MATGRPWSADIQFVQDVTTLKQEYINADFDKDIDRKITALRNLNLLIQPKVDVKDELDLIYKAEDSIPILYVKNKAGQIGVDVNNLKIMERFLNRLLSSMLQKLQDGGIYTQQYADPRKSMSTSFERS